MFGGLLSTFKSEISESGRICYPRRVQLPVNRQALGRRNQLDEADEAEQYSRETPATRLRSALGASELSRQLALAVGNDWSSDRHSDLTRKSALYVAPLRRLMR
jgi:hypothetical protein